MDDQPHRPGDPDATVELRSDSPHLIPLVYDQLRALAQKRLSEVPAERSLQATALVHEAYLRLAARRDLSWNDSQHFLAAAAQVIHWILVDRARRRLAARHGGGERPVTLDETRAGPVEPPEDLLAIDRALDGLRAVSRRKYEVVVLRYFGGLSIEETARVVGVSPATVKREWDFARAWLLVRLKEDG